MRGRVVGVARVMLTSITSGDSMNSRYRRLRMRQAGFTLVEMMVVVAVLSILAAIAVPNMQAMINSSRLTAQSNNLIAELQLARSEAVRRNQAVLICRSASGDVCETTVGAWSRWIIRVKNPATGETVLLRESRAKAPVAIRAAVPAIEFKPDGRARDASGAFLVTSLTVCMPTTKPAENLRTLNLAAGARITNERSNNKGACP